MANGKYRLVYSTSVVLFLSAAAPLALIFIVAPRILARVSQGVYMAIIEICFWATALAVLIIVLCWERKSLRSIGLRGLTMKDGLLALLSGVLLFAAAPALTVLLERVFGVRTPLKAVVAALAGYPIWLRALLAARAGFVEEILYRGYPIERLNSLTGRMWPGALVSLVIHTLIHIPTLGLGHTFGVVLPLSGVLAGLYVWKRNLTLNITVHFLTDFLVLALLPLLPSLP